MRRDAILACVVLIAVGSSVARAEDVVSGAASGAAGGAVRGAMIGGPHGAAAGAAVGAAHGAASDAIGSGRSGDDGAADRPAGRRDADPDMRP